MLIPLSTIANSLLRKRRLQQRHGSATRGVQYEVFSVAGPVHVYRTASTMKLALQVAQATAAEHPGAVISVWSPFRAHVHQGTVQDGQYITLHPRTAYFDTPEEVVDELVRYIATTDTLTVLLQQTQRNMADLLAKGVYDSQNAVKAFLPIADNAVRRYAEQYGGTQQEQYPHDIRRLTAERLTALFEQEYKDNPERIVEEIEQTEPQQVINLNDDDDPDGKSVIINIYASNE